MDSWQAFALGMGVASLIWLTVKIIADHIFDGVPRGRKVERERDEYNRWWGNITPPKD